MPAPPAKTAALEALRRELGASVCSGTEFLDQCERREPRLTSGLGALDTVLGGGLARGQLTEILVRGVSRGGGVILAELLAQARREGRYAMLLDVGSGFAVESFPERDLESLLWVGCDSARQAVEALDVATRDENFHLFLLDGRDCEAADWGTIRPQSWYRVLNQLRQREAVAVLFARSAVTAATRDRLEVTSRLELDCLHRERAEILRRGLFAAVEWVEPRHERTADRRIG